MHLLLPGLDPGPKTRAPAILVALLAALVAHPAPARAQRALLPSLAREAPSAVPLLIPVAGVRADELHDSFHAGRSGGREHRAIDIHAPRGTPVLAAADGIILKLHTGSLGGIAVYQLGDDGRTRYYYAHLDRYAEGLEEGGRVHRGDVIGYVGDTGNAAPGDFHLHFSIAVLEDVRRWWEGANLNPYPLLRDAGRQPFGLAFGDTDATDAPATLP